MPVIGHTVGVARPVSERSGPTQALSSSVSKLVLIAKSSLQVAWHRDGAIWWTRSTKSSRVQTAVPT